MNELVNVAELSMKQFEELEKQMMVRRLGELTNQVSVTNKNVEIIKEEAQITNNKVNYLSENMIGDSRAIKIIHTAGTKKVTDALGGKESEAYKKLSKKTFLNFWAYYKHKLQVPTYKDTPKEKYKEALEFIASWKPKSELQQEIDEINEINDSQIVLEM